MIRWLAGALGLRTVSLAQIERAFNHARRDLQEVGLLEDGLYLDHIGCEQTASLAGEYFRELACVFDEEVDWPLSVLGFTPGTIYISQNPPVEAYTPGGTLLDAIRHEFAHSWAWYDRRHVDGPWFREAFGARYDEAWDEAPEFDPAEYVSEYATTMPKEDFAETFMFFLKYRNSLERYASRPGVRRKLRAVQRAVKVAARGRLHRGSP